MILLDTCALLWLADGSPQLSDIARAQLSKQGGYLYVSAVSAWELGTKVATRKLQLPKKISRWFPEVCDYHSLQELPISAIIATAATELPLLHKDPADRILVATALEHKLTILSPDPLIAQYPNVQTAW